MLCELSHITKLLSMTTLLTHCYIPQIKRSFGEESEKGKESEVCENH